MTRPVTTIDLGVIGTEPSPAAPVPPGRRWRGWRQRRRHRGAATAAAFAIMVVAITVVAPPGQSPPGLVPVLSVDRSEDGHFMLTEDALYVVGGPSGGVTAYRIDDGRQQWQLPEYYYPMIAAYSPDALLVHEFLTSDGHPMASVVDPATGQIRWSDLGGLIGSGSDLAVLYRHQPVQQPDDSYLPRFDEQGPRTLVGVDLHTGEERWTIGPVTVASNWVDSRHLFLLDRDDRTLSSYDLRTGQRVASTHWSGPIDSSFLLLADDLLLLTQLWQDAISPLTAFDPATLEQRWHTEVAVPDGWPDPCGQLLCVGGNGALAGVDPKTGQTEWQTDRFGQWHLGSGLANGRPFLVTDEWVLDAATGEPLLQLDRWLPQSMGQTGPVLRWYEVSREEGTERTWFGRVTLDPPGVNVFGAVDARLSGCQFLTTLAACEVDDQIRIWRVTR